MNQILLTSDYGIRDPYLGLLKSELCHRIPTAHLIDIAHNVPVTDISLAAYFIKYTLSNRADKRIFISAVHNYYNAHPTYLVFERHGNFFIGPDNGLYSLVFEDLRSEEVFAIEPGEEWKSLYKMYAHVAACLSHGLSLSDVGRGDYVLDQKLMLRPVVTKDNIRATIIHVDYFGNVITNLTRSTFEKACGERPFKLYYDPHDPLSKIVSHYGEVEVGEVLCRFNQADYLEIGVNQGRAHELLNLQKNETIQIDFLS